MSWYEEQYPAALASLNTASQLEPAWTECKVQEQQSINFLKKLCEMVKTKGGLPNKRLQTLIKVNKSLL